MSDCPDTLILRLFAGGELEGVTHEDGRPVDAAAIEQHVWRCESCATLVERARREDALLRGVLPVEMPPSVHGETLAALDGADSKKHVSSRRVRIGSRGVRALRGPGRTGALLRLALSLVLLAAAGFAINVAFKNAPAPEPQDDSRKPAPPAPAAPAPKTPSEAVAPPRSEAAPAREPEKPEDPGPITKLPDPVTPPVETPPAETPPAETPQRKDVEGPPGTPRPGPAPVVEREERVLAVLRSGKLAALGKTLTVGEALPEGETVEATSSVIELESADSAKILVASGTKLSVAKGEGGVAVFFVASGKLLATTAGTKPYAIASADGRATPHGTSFLVAVEAGKTRVSTLEGRVQVDVERMDGVSVDVHAGFEADVAKGKAPEAPRPFVAARAVTWLPESARPKPGPAPRIIRAFGFEDGEGFNQGTIVPGGAHGSKHALKGATADQGAIVELNDERAAGIELDPNLWVEVQVKVSRATSVLVELGAKHRLDQSDREEPAFALKVRLEANRWTTIAAPVKDFLAFGMPPGPGGPGQGGGPGGPGAGGPGGPGRGHWAPRRGGAAPEKVARFAVVANTKTGEPVELLVDDVRFYRYEE